MSRGVVVEAYAQLRAEGWLEVRPGAAARGRRGVARRRRRGPRRGGPARRATTCARARPDPLLFPVRAGRPRCARAARRRPGRVRLPRPAGRARAAARARRVSRARRGGARAARRRGRVHRLGHALALPAASLRGAGARASPSRTRRTPGRARSCAAPGSSPSPAPVDDHGLAIDRAARGRRRARHARRTSSRPAPCSTPTGAPRSSPGRAPRRRDHRGRLRRGVPLRPPAGRRAAGPRPGPRRLRRLGLARRSSPALRLGWAVVPGACGRASPRRGRTDLGTATIDQLALAGFIERGEFDRHLRRSRAEPRAGATRCSPPCASTCPTPRVHGVAAGLHLVLEIGSGESEARAGAEAAGVGLARP